MNFIYLIFEPPEYSGLSENETIMPASKTRRLKEEHFGGFHFGVFETSGQTERFRTGCSGRAIFHYFFLLIVQKKLGQSTSGQISCRHVKFIFCLILNYFIRNILLPAVYFPEIIL